MATMNDDDAITAHHHHDPPVTTVNGDPMDAPPSTNDETTTTTTHQQHHQNPPPLHSFDALIQHIRHNNNHRDDLDQTNASRLPQQFTTEQQLELYGLYKHATTTSTTEAAPVVSHHHNSLWWSLRDRRKRAAWEAVRRQYTPAQAKERYVQRWREWGTILHDDPVDHGATTVESSSSLDPVRTTSAKNEENDNDNDPDGIPDRGPFAALQARGTLDLSNQDLSFALARCCCCGDGVGIRTLRDDDDHEIRQQWSRARRDALSQQQQQQHSTDPSHVMVGLSVRSLLDLYLQVQQYPAGSEIIMSPPISVPGMMLVLRHHQIQCVGVDTSTPENDAKSSDQVVSINLKGIQAALTPKTVAVLVVHVFGMMVASEQDLQQLQRLLDDYPGSTRPIHILEDAAECFTGLSSGGYLGSPLADLSFVSFGRIKTMSSIQGGIAVAGRDPRLIPAMTRRQRQVPEQSNWTFGALVVQCALLKWISQSPGLYGFIYTLVSGMGWNFDDVVTTLLRGFPNDPQQMMQRIRQRPSRAMLALLRRRLRQPPSSSIQQRIQFGRTLTDQIRNENRNGTKGIRTIVPKSDCEHYYWLYPILVEDRVAVSKHLRRCGFDATSGTLRCVAPPTTCPNANAMMDSILYLPIDSRTAVQCNSTNDHENSVRNRMRSLVAAVHGRTHVRAPQVPTTLARPQRFLQRGFLFLLVLYFWSFVTYAITVLLQLIVTVTMTYATLIWLLRMKMGNFYIESSKGFAKYNYLLNRVPGKDHNTNHGSNDSLTTNGLIFMMQSLQLPPILSDTKMRSVLLTGATGFVGSMLLRDLLFHRTELRIETVIVLCRAKKGKAAAERVASLLDDAMFSFLSQAEKQSLVQVIEGDVILPRAGLSDATIKCLTELHCVTHIFNCAASVSFTQSLPEAANANILSALNLQGVGSRISEERIQFVHMSTAFVHGGCYGKNGEPLLEETFSLGQFDPIKVYRSMTGTQFYASKAMNELSFPNTYTFSKCIAEHLLLSNDPSVIIIRPTIIGPALEFPYEGWAGRMPSTIVAATCLYLSYQWNIWSFGRHLVPVIPVDVVARFVVAKSFCPNESGNHETCFADGTSSDDSYDKISHDSSSKRSSPALSFDRDARYQIFNATWDVRSSRSSGFTWFEYAGAVTQVGCVTGYFTRPTAYLGLLFATKLIPRMKLKTHRFATIHDWCVKHPFDWMTQIRTKFGFSTSQMKRLHAFLNLPLLFYPFMNNSYHFRSELIAPPDLSGEHYLMICVAAAHKFIQQSQRRAHRHIDKPATELFTNWSLLINNASNSSVRGQSIFWAISQPYGNILVRITAWLLVHVLKRCFTEISVDIQSFAPAICAQKETGVSCTILAPTHRSIFDSIILTLVCFSIPELQIMMPSIAAADLFERIPLFGSLLHFLGAFFVRRGRMSVDPNLLDNVSHVKAKSFHPVVELFIEGTRSRDRRFVQPKTGVLRCLYDSVGQQTIVPIAINYERVAEQETLVAEASGGVPSELLLSSMISWLSVSRFFTYLRNQSSELTFLSYSWCNM